MPLEAAAKETKPSPEPSGSASNGFEILDTGPDDVPSRPVWEDPEIVGLLMSSDEPREWALASAVVRFGHLMGGHLARASRADRLDSARAEFEAGVATGRALQKAFRNLYDHHHKGVQRIVKEYSDGPTIGRQAKIASLTKPNENTADGRILQRIEWTARDYRNLGQIFSRGATAAEADLERMPHDVRTAQALSAGARWNELSADAYQESTRFDALYTRLERAGVQIVFVENRLGRPEKMRPAKKSKK
jgi:hypothetical protein